MHCHPTVSKATPEFVKRVNHFFLRSDISWTTPCRGKRKWGRADEGEAEESDIIMTLSEPGAVGNLFQVKADEKDVVDRLFSSISVGL